ncbi:sensor histidine kinase [Noviherbaspirillum galbum]|uniref:Histidine kinase/HSP90-like ATPase domain-containing protein n=1 Tax=Noviherbaspirillum galbum TaxID=2709383 RepID=A0A6B3SMZ1_9BURK|nr:ATP-binding protein [Noviherbaspirillum galbum]NEX62250.1 hypothetical protein [Noviherbaspirillum galbum]
MAARSLAALPSRLTAMPVILLLIALLVALCAVVPSGLAAPAGKVQAVTEVREAFYAVSDSASIPAADAGWRKTALPHREPRAGDHLLTPYWYRFSIDTGEKTDDTWLYFPKLRSGGAVFVNGVKIQQVRSADATHQVRWFRPFLFYVPPSALHAGTNEIAVNFAIREPLTSFGEVYAGPGALLSVRFDQALFWEQTSNKIAAVGCMLASLFVLALWIRRRQETLYGMFGLCLLFWGVRTFIFRLPVVPVDCWLAWRCAYYLTTNGFIVFITIFLLRFSRSESRHVTRILLTAWLGSLLAFAVIGASLRPAMDSIGTLFYLPFTCYAVARLILHAIRTRMPSAIAMVASIGVALLLALHDFAVQHGKLGFSETYLLHLGIPLYLLVMGVVLLDRFIDSLNDIETMNATLSQRVAERERELLASLEEVRRMEDAQSRADERQRIMQDIHDGVGSQLLTTLMLVKRGGMETGSVADMLQACLDDMRLTIDSLASSTPDFAAALGNLRLRMQGRLQALGIALDWPHVDFPAWFCPPPSTTIKLLRILQEALANVLKHAEASAVQVGFDFSDEALVMRVRDNGRGMPGAVSPAGHGMRNMRSRAGSIGATLDVVTGSEGTEVAVRVPRSNHVSAAASSAA